MKEVTVEEFAEICKLTVELTRLRQNECKHLCVENLGPEIFRGLLRAITIHKSTPIEDLRDDL